MHDEIEGWHKTEGKGKEKSGSVVWELPHLKIIGHGRCKCRVRVLVVEFAERERERERERETY